MLAFVSPFNGCAQTVNMRSTNNSYPDIRLRNILTDSTGCVGKTDNNKKYLCVGMRTALT